MKAITLDKNTKSPFDGILIDEDKALELRDAKFESKLYKKLYKGTLNNLKKLVSNLTGE